MVAVMRKAAQLNENEFCEQKEMITSLATENKVRYVNYFCFKFFFMLIFTFRV